MFDFTQPIQAAQSYAALSLAIPLLVFTVLGFRALLATDHPSQMAWVVIFLLAAVIFCNLVGPVNAGNVVVRVCQNFWDSLTELWSSLGGSP